MSAQFAGAPAADEARARRGEFIQNNLGLVHCCAGRFRGRGIEYEDLYAAGCLGLVKACDGFDPSRGLCFSTYAVPVILGEIKKLFRDGGTVKVSRTLKELGLKINAERERCLKRTGTEPGVTQLAETLGTTPEQIALAIRASLPALSLTPADDEDGTREWDIPVDSPEEALSERISLNEVLARLAPADRLLIRLRFFAGKTQSGADLPPRAQDPEMDARGADRGVSAPAVSYYI